MHLIEIGEELDSLVNTDVPARGAIRKLYPAARRLAKEPLCVSAAKLISESTSPGSLVLIGTGFPIPPTLIPETDGPPGAAALARALSYMLDVVPVILTEEIALPIVSAACRALELNTLSIKEAKNAGRSVAILPFTLDKKKAKEESKAFLDELDPSSLIVVEKVGINIKGIYHNFRGLDISKNSAKLDELVKACAARKVPTIGIGDGGNEVGMGDLVEEVRKWIPNGAKCQCPCRSGIACVTKTDLLVTGSISNWGAYGIEGALGALKGKPELIHDGNMEKRSIQACIASGAIDGFFGSPSPYVDGVSDHVNAAFVDLLKTAVVNGMARV